MLENLKEKKLNKKAKDSLIGIRAALGHAHGIAEALILLEAVLAFHKAHAEHARMPRQYPEAAAFRDALPWVLVSASCDTFAGEELPATCNECGRSGQTP